MRGVWIEDGTVSFRSDLPPPSVPTPLAERATAGRTDARVQVTLAGLCATDLALAKGYMGFRGVPGHEFVGVALEGPLSGQRVVGEINAACGTCATCRGGEERHCPTRTVLGILNHAGAFAEELVLPVDNLLAVPAGLADEAAVFTEPLAAAFEIAEQVELLAGTRALVIGDGRLGLLCAQVLALHGLEVRLHGRHPERGDWLPSGIEHRGDALASETERFELVVEATGRPDVFPLALARVRPRGTLVLKTTSEAPASIDLAPLVVDEIRLVGSRCGPFAPALSALAEGRIIVAPMLTRRFALEDAEAAFRAAARPGALKILFDIATP